MWDGEELLEASIKSVRASVDYIVVVYQTISNFGNMCSEQLVPLLERLQAEKLIDELVYFEPHTSLTNREKREMVSPYAENLGMLEGNLEV